MSTCGGDTEVEPLYRHALAGLEKAFGPEHPDTLGSANNLACYECLSGNHEESKRLIAEEIAADPEKKEQALQDSDLEAIREFIRGLPLFD